MRRGVPVGVPALEGGCVRDFITIGFNLKFLGVDTCGVFGSFALLIGSLVLLLGSDLYRKRAALGGSGSMSALLNCEVRVGIAALLIRSMETTITSLRLRTILSY